MKPAALKHLSWRDQRGSFLKHKFRDSIKSLSRLRWNINRAPFPEIPVYIWGDIVSRFRLEPELLFSWQGARDFFPSSGARWRQCVPELRQSQDRRGAVGDAVPARGKASVSDATPLWSDQSDSHHSASTLARRNRTRGSSDSSRTRSTCDMRGVVVVAESSLVTRDRGTVRSRRYDRDVRAT